MHLSISAFKFPIIGEIPQILTHALERVIAVNKVFRRVIISVPQAQYSELTIYTIGASFPFALYILEHVIEPSILNVSLSALTPARTELTPFLNKTSLKSEY